MNIIPTTKPHQNISRLEKLANKASRMINLAVDALNESHAALWSLPDVELQEVLQEMVNSGTMESVFTSHYVAAISLNAIQEQSGEAKRAIAVAGREFSIEDGVVNVVPIPESEVFSVEESISSEESVV